MAKVEIADPAPAALVVDVSDDDPNMDAKSESEEDPEDDPKEDPYEEIERDIGMHSPPPERAPTPPHAPMSPLSIEDDDGGPYPRCDGARSN